MKTIDAKVLSRMFLAGAKNLEAKKEWIMKHKYSSTFDWFEEDEWEM